MTGSTGLIGRRWLPLLLEADVSRHVTVMVRDPARVIRHPRVTTVIGDLRLPRLGFSSSTWESLTGTITEIVHCAADIRFNRPLAEARAANTDGTGIVLALARESDRLRRFAHVSTAYVMGRDSGELPESAYCNRNGFVNTYEQSKYEAEGRVFASMAGLPVAVFRLSSVVGDQPGYFEKALRLVPQYRFPLMPGLPEARVDLIDVRWAAAALDCLFERHFEANSVYHVCAGREASIPVWQLAELAFSAMPAERRPALVRGEEFDRFTERFLRSGAGEGDKLMLRSASSFLPHLAIDQSFRNEVTLALLRRNGFPDPDSAEVVRTTLAGLSGITSRAGTSGRADTVKPRTSKEPAT